MEGIHFDAIFSSDLGRSVQTAEILNVNRQLEINTTKLLRENFFGTYEGKPAKVFLADNKKLFEKRKQLSDAEKMRFKYEPTQESDQEAAIRMITFLREIGATYGGKTVLVVSHGSIMRSFLKHLGFAKYEELPGGAIENAGYIVVESDGIDFFIKETKGVNKQKI